MKIDPRIITAALANPLTAKMAWESFTTETEIENYPSEMSWVGGYIYFNLQNSGIDLDYLRNIYRYNYLANNYRLAQVSNTLTSLNRISVITPIKSFGLSLSRHSLGQRPVGDFDFYVEPEVLNKFRKSLEENGFYPLMGITDELFESEVRGARGSWNFVNSKNDDLDLHWRIFDHLSERSNKRLVQNNSTFVDGKFGLHRQLNKNLAAVQIGSHHLASASLHWGSLFDFASLLKEVEISDLLRMASAIDMSSEIKDVIRIVEDHSQNKILSRNRNHLNLKPVFQPRYHLMIPKRFQQQSLHVNLKLYSIWRLTGSFSGIERKILNRIGHFSKSSDSLSTKEDNNFIDNKRMKLGFGWHYRFPDDSFRWACYPDARIHIDFGSYKKVRIILDRTNWIMANTKSIDIFANGIYLGSFSKPDVNLIFDIPAELNSTFELSIRSHPDDRRKLKGYGFSSRRLLAPIKKISLIN
jgi:Uncharacterised nucleotidyltransferase